MQKPVPLLEWACLQVQLPGVAASGNVLIIALNI